MLCAAAEGPGRARRSPVRSGGRGSFRQCSPGSHQGLVWLSPADVTLAAGERAGEAEGCV